MVYLHQLVMLNLQKMPGMDKLCLFVEIIFLIMQCFYLLTINTQFSSLERFVSLFHIRLDAPVKRNAKDRNLFSLLSPLEMEPIVHYLQTAISESTLRI